MKKIIVLPLFLVLFGILGGELVFAETYSVEFNQFGNELEINEIIDNVQNKSYIDKESLNFAGDEIYFLNKIIFPKDFEKATITLNLEKGIVVKNKEIFPLGYEIKSDGQIISISWNLVNVKEGNTFAIFVNLEDTTSSSSFIWLFVILFLILIGIFWSVRFNKKKKPLIKQVKNSKKEKVNSPRDYDYLLDTEKKIIEYLKKSNRNELWQKQIQNSTGFSKAKVSRLIRTLESRGLIKKIPFGNTNKIRLK
jgi:uncharacterized membrane protein